MNSIRSYVNDVFAGLPQTAETKKMKEDMLAKMEEKYQSLCDKGLSEDEAASVTIYELGNADELHIKLNHTAGMEKVKETTKNTPDPQYTYEVGKEKRIAALAWGFWPCIIAIYLLWSVIGGDWQRTWIIWPVAAIVFCVVSGVIARIYIKKDSKKQSKPNKK